MSMSLSVKCICPSCFEEIFLGECGIYSGITGKMLKPPSKGPLARMRVESLDGPRYTSELAQRKCTNPNCGYLLPYNIDIALGLTFVVVGDFNSGKSHYLAALIHQIKSEWIGRGGFARLQCLTPAKAQEYDQDYFTPLFGQQPRAILNTQRALSKNADPLIYELLLSPSPKHPPKIVNLMIYDTSGEDYEVMQRLVAFARFVLNTNAFIFIVDPVMMAPFFSSLPASIQTNPNLVGNLANSAQRRPADVVTSTISLFDRYRGSSSGTRLSDVPVAIMISKADLFGELNPRPNYQFMADPYYQMRPDRNDLLAVDQEVRGLLSNYQQADLLVATSRFRRVQFFATSATGAIPDPVNATYQFVKPRRCLDPFLWILSELGVI